MTFWIKVTALARVSVLQEIEVEADTEEEARAEALSIVENQEGENHWKLGYMDDSDIEQSSVEVTELTQLED